MAKTKADIDALLSGATAPSGNDRLQSLLARAVAPPPPQLGFDPDRFNALNPAYRSNAAGIAQQQEAEALGISREGAPAKARAIASLGGAGVFTPGDLRDFYEKSLSSYYGAAVPVKERPEVGGLTFINPETGKETLVDPAGPDLGDMASLAGDMIVAIPEMAGGAVGTAGGFLGTAAGAAIGASVGEFMRLKLGQQYGINANKDDTELAKMAIANGGAVSLLGSAAGHLVVRFVAGMGTRGAAAVGLASRDVPGLSSEAMKEGAEAMEPVVSEVARVTGRRLRLLPSQTLDQESTVAERMRGLEVTAEKSRFGEPVRQTRDEQRAIIDEFKQRALKYTPETKGKATDVVDLFALGRDIQQVTSEKIAARKARLDASLDNAEDAARRAALDITRGARDPELVGAPLREAVENHMARKDAYFDKQYDDIKSMLFGGDAAIRNTDFASAAKKYKDVLEARVFKSLSELDNPILRDALAAPEWLSFTQMQKAISDLRFAQRRLKSGTPATVAKAELDAVNDLLNGLIRDRSRGAHKWTGDPEILHMLDAVEREYSEYMDEVGRTVVGRYVMKTGEKGIYQVPESELFGHIMRNKETAEAVYKVLSQDPESHGAIDAIRAGIASDYERKVIRDGIIDPARHRRYVQDNRYAIDAFYGPGASRRNTERVIPLTEQYLDIKKRYDLITKHLEKTFKARLDARDPSSVFRYVWQERQGLPTLRLKSILKDSPDIWQAFQKSAADHAWATMTSNGENTLTAGAVRSYRMRFGPNLKATFGEQYVNNMATLEAVLRQTEMKGAAIASRGKVNALYDLVRAYVGLFTRPGRVVTAYRKITGRSAEKAIAEALSDADRFRSLMELRKFAAGSARAAEILGGFGAWSLITKPEVVESTGTNIQ